MDPVTLGCSKCRYSARGCGRCRGRAASGQGLKAAHASADQPNSSKRRRVEPGACAKAESEADAGPRLEDSLKSHAAHATRRHAACAAPNNGTADAAALHVHLPSVSANPAVEGLKPAAPAAMDATAQQQNTILQPPTAETYAQPDRKALFMQQLQSRMQRHKGSERGSRLQRPEPVDILAAPAQVAVARTAAASPVSSDGQQAAGHAGTTTGPAASQPHALEKAVEGEQQQQQQRTAGSQKGAGRSDTQAAGSAAAASTPPTPDTGAEAVEAAAIAATAVTAAGVNAAGVDAAASEIDVERAQRRAAGIRRLLATGTPRSKPRSTKLPRTPHDITVSPQGPAASGGSFGGSPAASHVNPRISLWVPPASPFSLLEEVLYDDPWKLLVACVLLNKTSGKQVRRVLGQLLAAFPTPEAMAAAAGVQEVEAHGEGGQAGPSHAAGGAAVTAAAATSPAAVAGAESRRLSTAPAAADRVSLPVPEAATAPVRVPAHPPSTAPSAPPATAVTAVTASDRGTAGGSASLTSPTVHEPEPTVPPPAVPPSTVLLSAVLPAPVQPVTVPLGGIPLLESILRPLGLYRVRASGLVRFSREYLTKQWSDPRELHGIGQYAADAYWIFCRGAWRDVHPDDKDLKKYRAWLQDTAMSTADRVKEGIQSLTHRVQEAGTTTKDDALHTKDRAAHAAHDTQRNMSEMAQKVEHSMQEGTKEGKHKGQSFVEKVTNVFRTH